MTGSALQLIFIPLSVVVAVVGISSNIYWRRLNKLRGRRLETLSFDERKRQQKYVNDRVAFRYYPPVFAGILMVMILAFVVVAGFSLATGTLATLALSLCGVVIIGCAVFVLLRLLRLISAQKLLTEYDLKHVNKDFTAIPYPHNEFRTYFRFCVAMIILCGLDGIIEVTSGLLWL